MNELRCICGGKLELETVFDGMSAEAVSYDENHCPDWDWVVQLICTQCPRVYPIARTDNRAHISLIRA